MEPESRRDGAETKDKKQTYTVLVPNKDSVRALRLGFICALVCGE